MSVALEICRIVEDQVGRTALAAVREVAVEVGRSSGVEADNLEFCLEALLSRPPFAGARPVLIRRPGDVLRVRWLEVDDDQAAGAGGGASERETAAWRTGSRTGATTAGAEGGPR